MKDFPATLFGEIKDFKGFPVRFSVKYIEKNLVEKDYEMFYDKMYATFYDKHGKFVHVAFGCSISKIDLNLVSKFANNIDKVRVEFHV